MCTARPPARTYRRLDHPNGPEVRVLHAPRDGWVTVSSKGLGITFETEARRLYPPFPKWSNSPCVTPGWNTSPPQGF
ncbi:hypothetical protein [Hymenobacter lapidarius]|uniref:hypothetical protein n=1 Tax=Hymenobacter lapidarius TaxID=1908237 RepID=UPI000F777483|nr:hypothetical protein [Hymenobacter lapidarius]